MRHRKKQKKYAKERGLSGWRDVMVWRDFKPLYVSKAIWVEYIQQMTSKHFMQWSQSNVENQNKEIHGSITTHTSGSIMFGLHAKRMV